jgi:hypothetical protein
MNREELVKILESELWIEGSGIGGRRIRNRKEAADLILAALEKEREREVVLGIGRLIDVQPHPCGPTYYACNKNYSGREGQLIFRPTKEAR